MLFVPQYESPEKKGNIFIITERQDTSKYKIEDINKECGLIYQSLRLIFANIESNHWFA